MFEAKSKSNFIHDIQYLRSKKRLPAPAPHTIVRTGVHHRLLMWVDASIWLKNANTLREILWVEIGFIVLSLMAGGIAFCLSGAPSNVAFNFNEFGFVLASLAVIFGVIGIAAPGGVGFLIVLFGLSAIAAGWDLAALKSSVGGGEQWDIVASYAVIFGVASWARLAFDLLWGGFRNRTGHKGDKRQGSDTLSLNFKHADKVTDRFKAILSDCWGDKKIEKLSSIMTDREEPYRVIKDFLPVGPFFFRRPRQFLENHLSRTVPKYRRYRIIIDMTDALCAGMLGLVGSRPRLRYGEESDDPLAKDRFWRNDSQEINDTGSSDVFLRFHQSTVEADFPPKSKAGDVCNYKTYATINNFRRMPLYLLRVRDIVDVLYCRHHDYSPEQQQKIYEGLNINDAETTISYLSASRFSKQTARADRYQHEAIEQLGKAIIDFTDDEKTDAIMSFDPGRVWPAKDAPIEFFDAIIALRRAIHVASRKSAIEVTLNRRDVLLVDNLRLMICRREDGATGILTPFSWLRDTFTASFDALSTRWLRQIYGFPEKKGSRPVDTQASLSENNDPQKEMADEEESGVNYNASV